MTQEILNSIKSRLHRYGRWIRVISNTLLASVALMLMSQLMVKIGMYPRFFKIIGYITSFMISVTATIFLLVVILVAIEFLFGTLEFGIFGWIGGKNDKTKK